MAIRSSYSSRLNSSVSKDDSLEQQRLAGMFTVTRLPSTAMRALVLPPQTRLSICALSSTKSVEPEINLQPPSESVGSICIAITQR